MSKNFKGFRSQFKNIYNSVAEKAAEKKKSKFSDETLRNMSEKMMGNTNAIKNKPFRDMLTRKIIQNPVKLEKIVDKLLKEAEKGEAEGRSNAPRAARSSSRGS
jgi:hypothetical protein